MIAAEPTEALELVTEVERGLEELESLGDAEAQEKATRVVQALFELYGAGLERIVDVIASERQMNVHVDLALAALERAAA